MRTCKHDKVGWPMRRATEAVARQRCLDCGWSRTYDLQQGITGEWVPDELTPKQLSVIRPEFRLTSFLLGVILGMALNTGIALVKFLTWLFQ